MGPPPQPDTDRGLMAVLSCADTAEWDDTDQEIEAQGTIDTTPVMFEDTGVVILDRPLAEPARTDTFVVTFRTTRSNTRPLRASTAEEWPPEPRAPAVRAPQIRDRAFKHAGIYKIVLRPETKH